ncbi:hypothetical protein OPS25_05870 [Alteromonas ponticola]|uniref:HEAT repeat domain-containing protein n=1 Tax=Alteromonas aquimaris TaxID=2998417 RepID=A0ABT3P5I9_9ALTE|nr:hypothetical protein [Alteromonas aquimaris]MCW8108020.1 hypothetical protein [Alteromonas aquimaris]
MSAETDPTEYENNIPKEIAALQDAILEHDNDRIRLLLTNELLDEVQKSHLVELAKSKGTPSIVKLLENTPSTP